MEVQTTIRQAQESDASAIQALTHTAYKKWVAVLGREPRPMTIDYSEAVKKHRFDLLFNDLDLAALIGTVQQDDHLLIVNVAVAPEFQGRGFGIRLLKLAEELSAAASLQGTKLYTNKLFTENLSLYTWLGYTLEREEEHPTLGTVVYMTKDINKTLQNI